MQPRKAAELPNFTAGPNSHLSLCTFPPNVPDGYIIPQMSIVWCVPANRHRCWHLCLVKGTQRTVLSGVLTELSFGLPCVVQIIGKKNHGFPPPCGILQKGFSGAACLQGWVERRCHQCKSFVTFQKYFFQFDFKFVGNMLFQQTLLQRWHCGVWNGSIHEPQESHGIRAWFDLGIAQQNTNWELFDSHLRNLIIWVLMHLCLVLQMCQWSKIAFENWSSLQY